jgi:hypothetical protein
MGPRARLVVLASMITFALAASSPKADAAATRAEYVAQVEPICHAAQAPTFKAYSALFKAGNKIRASERAGNFQGAVRLTERALGRFYAKVSAIYAATTIRLSTVTPAPGDESTVAGWLAGRNQAIPIGIQASRAAKHGKVKLAARLSNQAVLTSERAASLVATYGLTYCALPWAEAQGD